MEGTCKKRAKTETQCKVEVKKESLENVEVQEEAKPALLDMEGACKKKAKTETQCKVEIKQESLEYGEVQEEAKPPQGSANTRTMRHCLPLMPRHRIRLVSCQELPPVPRHWVPRMSCRQLRSLTSHTSNAKPSLKEEFKQESPEPTIYPSTSSLEKLERPKKVLIADQLDDDSFLGMERHPAPLPLPALHKNLSPIPLKLRLKIACVEKRIALLWDIIPTIEDNRKHAPLTSFDIFGYEEQKNVSITSLLWTKIGSVKATTLPMGNILMGIKKENDLRDGCKYHFFVRAMDMHNRYCFFSDPVSIIY